jgi:hypothetical protein
LSCAPYGSARTTAALRRAIQQSQESIAKLAKRYDVHPNTVAKWQKRSPVADAPMGPKQPRSTVFSREEEALMVAFRKHTLLPLNDCLDTWQATLPHLTRSALHRCLQRHGSNRLPEMDGDKPAKQKFKPYPLGYVHIDIVEVRTEAGKRYLCVGIDRTCTFAHAELHEEANNMVATQFPRHLVAAVPDQLQTVGRGGQHSSRP